MPHHRVCALSHLVLTVTSERALNCLLGTGEIGNDT